LGDSSLDLSDGAAKRNQMIDRNAQKGSEINEEKHEKKPGKVQGPQR